jgi:hypothetical protein
MDISKEQSKIEYSKWEIDNKKDNPHPASSDPKKVTEVDTSKADALFDEDEEDTKPDLD